MSPRLAKGSPVSDPDPATSAAAGGGPKQRAGPNDLGSRLVVRVLTGGIGPSGNPEMTDVVGVLADISQPTGEGSQTWRIRKRDDSLVPVDSKQVVVVKRLGDPPTRVSRAVDITTRDLEELAAAGWQPLEAAKQQDWILRAAGGFTGRANSVLPLSDRNFPADSASFDNALQKVRDWYTTRKLKAMFAVPLPWQSPLDDALDARGWQAKNKTHVMVAEVPEILVSMGVTDPERLPVVLSDHPSPAWLDTYSYRGERLPNFAATIMLNADQPLFAQIVDPAASDGQFLAVGRAALAQGWVGITAVDVRQAARRRRLATDIARALLTHAYLRGYRHAYLQVATENTGARALYEKLGFVDHHYYHYRTAPQSKRADRVTR